MKFFEYVDIIEVDGNQTRHVHNESGDFYRGLHFIYSTIGYILASSDYSKTTVITKEEAIELSDKRSNLVNEEWFYLFNRNRNFLSFINKKREL